MRATDTYVYTLKLCYGKIEVATVKSRLFQTRPSMSLKPRTSHTIHLTIDLENLLLYIYSGTQIAT